MKVLFLLVVFFAPAFCDDEWDVIYLIEQETFGITSESFVAISSFATVQESNIILYLYTQSNPSSPEKLSLDVSDLESSEYYSSSRKNVFIIHGWLSSYSSEINTVIRDAYLELHDVNVFVVDWSKYSYSLYTVSSSATAQGGAYLGKFILDMQKQLSLTSSDFILIGHSLGAHFAGNAGAASNSNVSVIIGLDPAGPGFRESKTTNRLDSGDAKFVQGIHTSAGTLGASYSVGHADYWPNGGNKQKGCILDVFRVCSHLRAYNYLAESITSGNFISYACDSYSLFSSGQCSGAAVSHMGGYEVDTSASGDYFLDTASSSPYALGETLYSYEA